MKELRQGRTSARLVNNDGSISEGNDKQVVVFLLGARSNQCVKSLLLEWLLLDGTRS